MAAPAPAPAPEPNDQGRILHPDDYLKAASVACDECLRLLDAVYNTQTKITTFSCPDHGFKKNVSNDVETYISRVLKDAPQDRTHATVGVVCPHRMNNPPCEGTDCTLFKYNDKMEFLVCNTCKKHARCFLEA